MSYDCQIWAKSFWFGEHVCAWQVEVDFGVLCNKNNDCVISGLREFSCMIGSYQIVR